MLAKRMQGIEILRIFAIFMVVLIHSAPEYKNNAETDLAALILQSISRAGFIAFFLISGYFALNEKIINLKKFYYNSFIAIFIPFIIYAYIHFYMLHFNYGRAEHALIGFFSLDTISQFLHAVIIGPDFNGSLFVSIHFWFVYWIIGAYLVSPFIGYVIQRIEPAVRLKSILFFLLISWVHLYIGRYFPAANVIALPYIVNDWFVYFLIGGLMNGVDLRSYRKYSYSLLFVGYGLTLLLTWLNYDVLSINQSPYNIDINMVLCVAGIFMLFYSLKETAFTNWIVKFSKYTYSIYLSHVFIMYFLSGFTKTATANATFNALLTAICTFLVALVFSIVVDNLLVFRLVNLLKLRKA